MPVSFERLEPGAEYTRPQLAEFWGYESFHAISRGIVTPRDTPHIILFITREKQEVFTQYEDRLEGGGLDIEGETNHVADDRIIHAAEQDDQIHLFYRDRHHMPFTYYGQIHLTSAARHADSPSRFSFRVLLDDDGLETELVTHGQATEEFMPDEEGRRRIEQHVRYERSRRNRCEALRIHGNRCLACGFSFDDVYGPEHARGFIEIHHVESITEAEGPVHPETDLIPLCSNCHSMAHRETGRILSLAELRALLGSQACREASAG